MIKDMGKFSACLGKIAAQGRMTEDEAAQILQQLESRMQRERMKTGTKDPLSSAAKELAEELRIDKRWAKALEIRNARIRADVLNDIDPGGVKGALTVLKSLLHGTSIGARESIQSMWKGLSSTWMSQLALGVEKLGVTKVLEQGLIDRDIVKGLFAALDGTKVSISKQAEGTANIFASMLNEIRYRLNSAGANIRNSTDYILHSQHDPYKLRGAAGAGKNADEAFQVWWAFTRPLLRSDTFEKVFPEEGQTLAQATDAFGRRIFNEHISPAPVTFKFSTNVVKKVGRQDELIFKNADSWFDYMQKFSRSQTMMETMLNYLDYGARNLALMSKLGSNPRANLDQIIESVVDKYKDDLDSVRKFQEGVPGLENVMDHLDGRASVPVKEMWARIGAGARTVDSVSYLGGVGITHLASIWATVPAELVHHGVSRFEALGKVMKNLIPHITSPERAAVDAQLGTFSRGLTRDMFSRWNAEDSIPGRISNIANTFMKWTGIHWVFDNTTIAIKEMLANHLARNLGTDFENLSPGHQQILGKYGIDKDSWRLLRSVELRRDGGFAYLTPDLALTLDDDLVRNNLLNRGKLVGLSPDGINQTVYDFKQTLADQLVQYYHDAASNSIVTSGVRERALVIGGSRPGTFEGELRRFMAQFKMWPIAATYSILGREFYLSQSKKAAAWNIGTILGFTALAGYMRLTANNLVQGKSPPSISPQILLESLAKGGGLGIFGDLLFGQVGHQSSSTRNFLANLAGPIPADVNEFFEMFHKFENDLTDGKTHKKGEFSDIWPELARYGVRHVPFANLFYLKGALDYLLWYHLYEAVDPGWWERSNRRLKNAKQEVNPGYIPGKGVPFVPPAAALIQ